MITKYLVVGGYGEWGVPFDTEEDALKRLYHFLKNTGKYEEVLPKVFTVEDFDLEEIDPQDYFVVEPWFLSEDDALPRENKEENLMGYAISLPIEDDLYSHYGFFNDYDDGEAYHEKYQEILELPDDDDWDIIEIQFRLR